MTLFQLVSQAMKKDLKFNRYMKKMYLMKKDPPFTYLMTRLENILGEEYVKDAARREIERSNKVDEARTTEPNNEGQSPTL